jgi:hypothetical protein
MAAGDDVVRARVARGVRGEQQRVVLEQLVGGGAVGWVGREQSLHQRRHHRVVL